MIKRILLTVLFACGILPAASAQSADVQAVNEVLKRFYDGWNTHDPDMMVSAFAEDIDHINVFGEWHKGKAEIRKDLEFMHGPKGPARTSQKAWTVEKLKMASPTVAVVQVSSTSAAGPNLGTWIVQKQQNQWLIISFTNVIPQVPPYKKK